MNKKDKKLIRRFVQQVTTLTNLECIILFGSMARGTTDNRSDIDLLLVFDEEKPKTHLSQVMDIVTNLKPHREIRPVLTNLTDVDEAFLQTVLREGEVLWGSIVVSSDDLRLKPYRLFSYMLRGLKPSEKVKISRIIHGYQSKKMVDGKLKEYTYEGLKDKYDVEVISKNTVLVPEKHASSFSQQLERHAVSYQEKQVWA